MHAALLSEKRCEQRIRTHTPRRLDGHYQQAATSVLLRFCPSAQVLLMQRATHASDRWSGHISLPGGRTEPQDATLLDTAIRETREEVGIDLSATARYVGELDTMQAVSRGGPQALAVTPFVFIETRATEVVLNREATDYFWLPLDRVVANELAGTHEVHIAGRRLHLDCWRYDGFVVWGMTHRMLLSLLDVITG